MIVEISPTKIVKGATTVWHEPGLEVDIVMDPKNLTFREGSIDELYSFHVLERLFRDEASAALRNWKGCLKLGGSLFVIVDDFEYLSRAYVGGDISLETFNRDFSHPIHFDRDFLIAMLVGAGFKENNLVAWFNNVKNYFERKHYEIVLSAKNA